MPKPRLLEKYEVDESRCILCGICVDACPYDALRCGPDFELAHTSREEPMIDLIAIAAVDRETEITYVRRERDWASARRRGALHRRGRSCRCCPRPALAAERQTGTARGTDRDARPQAERTPTRSRDRCAGPVDGPCRSVPSSARAWDDVLFASRRHARLAPAVVDARDIIRCGLAMIVCFVARGDLRPRSGAPLVAAAQVLVYIGAISVLVLFAIMLTQTKAARVPRLPDAGRPGGDAAASLRLIGRRRRPTDWQAGAERRERTDTLARVLFDEYVLPFEVVSVLLLAAVIGGVFIAKREEEPR
jgi:NADH:ubiquinone oxidoreductase subunit 6 (subunit J)/Fe-S-cluster-containing hydrogenase component 2